MTQIETPLETAALNAQQFSINLVLATALVEVLRRSEEVEAFAYAERGSYSSRETVRQARAEVQLVLREIVLQPQHLGFGAIQA